MARPAKNDPAPSNPSVFKRLARIEGHNHARALNWACFHGRPFLRSRRACEWVATAIDLARRKHGFHVWARCIMPSHVHLLVFPTPPRMGGTGIAPILRTIKQSSSKRALVWLKANAPDRMGAFRDQSPSGKVAHRLWQRGGGYDRNMFSDRAIWSEIDYIHQNPVEDGLCRSATEWEWSSARQYATGDPGPIALDLSKLPGRP